MNADLPATPGIFVAVLADHELHQWREVGSCVYCIDCNVRLYQGEVPDRRDPGRAERQAACDHEWDPDMGQGFYFLCMNCGFKEWGDFGDE